ncbi:hypothetical protein EDB80DRAFT_734189, partial [Ilyonectria destructans]
MPPAIGGQFGMFVPSPIPPINPMNSPVREQVMQTSTFHWPPSIPQPQGASYPMLCEEHFTYTSNSESAPCQLPPILPRLRAPECGLVGPGPITASSTLWARQIDNRLPSIGDYLKQTLPPAMPPHPSPSKASLAVNSQAWEHVPPRGFHMLSFRAAELGVPNIEAQTTTPQTSQASFRAIEPRFGVAPYVVPEQVLAKLVERSKSGEKHPKLSEFKDSEGLYSCPFCLKQFARGIVFVKHLSNKHNNFITCTRPRGHFGI